MPGNNKLEPIIENILHHERYVEHKQEEERKTSAADYALHHSDLSSGSETMDDSILRTWSD